MPTRKEPSPIPEGDREALYRVYLEAEQVQDACNLSGVARSLAEATTWIWAEANAFGQGTDYVNSHPVVTLFLCKMLALNGTLTPLDTYCTAARKVGLVRCLGMRWLITAQHSDALDETINRTPVKFILDPRD